MTFRRATRRCHPSAPSGPSVPRKARTLFLLWAGGSARPSGVERMKGLILAPQHNKPGRTDATGVFQAGANYFHKLYGFPKVFFDNSGAGKAVRDRVVQAIDAQAGGWDVFAYFGHGDDTRLS